VVNGCTHCTPENTHWTPGIIASNGCAGATPARAPGANLRCAHPLPFQASGRHPLLPVWEKGVMTTHGNASLPARTPIPRDAPAPQGLPRAQGGLQPAPSLVLLIRTPKRSLLPVWEKGGRGDEGANAHGNARTPGAHLRCARLRRVPRQRRSSPAGASTRSGRVQPAPSPRFSSSGRPNAPFSPRGRRGSGG
jgi:hypothetical protein